MRHGRIQLIDGERERTFGATEESLPTATLEVLDPSFYRSLALGGSIGAAESYVDGAWRSDDLTGLVRVIARNPQLGGELEGGLARLRRPARRLAHLLRTPTRRASRDNIMAHYDLGNEFFRILLDPTMMYSCAVFPTDESTLEQASAHKVERVCQKLDLRPGQRLLEIGTGWGYFAVHAARAYGCRVVTTTISPSQRALAEARIGAAGLTDRIEVIQRDYRELDPRDLGTFDRLVSIEMIEAVGHRYLPSYFATISRMLEPTGRAVLQAITIPDQKYDAYRRSVDFIQRHIFPGSLLPSLGRITACLGSHTDLRLVDLEDITEHYPPTLRAWRENLLSEPVALDELGLDERFRRLWEYYFCYCEGGFLERVIADVQLVLAKPLERGSLHRGPLERRPVGPREVPS